jgi:SAM-dependent methyltransferase
VEPGLPQLAEDCLGLLEAEGVLQLWRRLGRFDAREFVSAAARELGYAVGGNRARMLGMLLDLACECGWLVRDGPLVRSTDFSRPRPTGSGKAPGDLSFFRACLEVVPSYLRGETGGIAFDPRAEGLWDSFLGSPLYSFARRWLLQRAGLEDDPSLRCLDVAFGTGQSTAALCRQFPAAFKVAVDTHGHYQAGAARRSAGVLAGYGRSATGVSWVPPSLWRGGFDADLPFADGAFGLVLLSCGDPYIRGQRREGFYREVHRVLRPGGRFALLTWPYPEAGVPGEPSVRLRALLHDFAESVCRGWHGFQPIRRLEEGLASAKFRPTMALGGASGGSRGRRGSRSAHEEGRDHRRRARLSCREDEGGGPARAQRGPLRPGGAAGLSRRVFGEGAGLVLLEPARKGAPLRARSGPPGRGRSRIAGRGVLRGGAGGRHDRR